MHVTQFCNLTISPIPVLSNIHGHLFRASLIPRLPRNANVYHRESLVSFLRKHDVIEIGLKQKGNVLCVVQPTMHSTLKPHNTYRFRSKLTVLTWYTKFMRVLEIAEVQFSLIELVKQWYMSINY